MAEVAASRMVELAEAARPTSPEETVSVLQLAASLGIGVTLRASTSSQPSHARLAYSTPPEIGIYRNGKTEFRRRLGPNDERLLRPRERFSVAHEVGHWLAWHKLGIEPISTGRAYWEQEALMNEFAQALLVPSVLVAAWLRNSQLGRLVHPMQLRRWAESLLVSEDVVANALCRVRPELGILRLDAMEHRRTKAEFLRIRFRAGGTSLSLPNIHTHVNDGALLELLSSAELGIAEEIVVGFRRDCRARVSLAWRRTTSRDASSASYRVIVVPSSDKSDRQLQLPID
jgi:hypothetical protein